MIRPWLVALRELRTYLQDKADLSYSLLLPIVTFALMYGAFGGQDVFHATAHVVNEDKPGTYSTLLLERLEALDNLDVKLISPEEAERKLARSDLLMVLFIPQGFSQRLAAREPARLILRQRGNGGQEGQIVASLIRAEVERINQEFQVRTQVVSRLAGRGIPPEVIETTVEKFLNREREHPIVGITEETVGSRPDLVSQYLPGIVTMYVLFAITLTSRAIVEERRRGTLERLMTTRLSVGELFMGKFLANISRGFVQTLVLLALSYAVFQLFTPLSFLQSLVVALLFAMTGSALGLVIASVARSEDAATWIAVFFTMAMVMFSGTFFPISPGSVLYILSKLSVNTYANSALRTLITQGGSLADAGLELGVMAGVTVVALVVSRILFRVMPGGR